MSNNKIPTAEEIFKPLRNSTSSYPVGAATYINIEDAKKFARQLTKLHVEAALKAYHKAHQLPNEDIEFTLSAYPLTNIV